jgi:hypothetical protein
MATIAIICFDTRSVYVAHIENFFILFSSARDRNFIAKLLELAGVCNAE